MSPSFQEFLGLEPEDGLEYVLESDEHAAVVRDGFGNDAFNQFLALAKAARSTARHLRITPSTNVLFFPGIMGSSLGSEQLGGIWWLDLTNLGTLNRLRLSPSGETDANIADDVVPLTTDHRYTGFLEALSTQREKGLVHDRFAYDWRKSLRRSADAARDRIVAIHERNGGRPVHLAAHSMGGVLIRVTLMTHGDELWRRIGKIAFIATPHYGAPAIGGYLKNHFWGMDKLVVLGRYLDRETFRSMRGAIGLLPAPIGVYPATRAGEEHPCANFNLYDASAWHLDLSRQQTARLEQVLEDAAQLHRDLLAFHHSIDQGKRDKMLVIAGVGFKTLFRLESRKRFRRWEKMVKVTDQDPTDPNRLGDGRVPLPSATLENVGATRYAGAAHSALPNVSAVYQDVFNWFTGKPLALPTTPGGALARHLSATPLKTAVSALDDSANATGDDPGYLDLSPPDQSRIAQLMFDAEAGNWPDLRFVSIL